MGEFFFGNFDLFLEFQHLEHRCVLGVVRRQRVLLEVDEALQKLPHLQLGDDVAQPQLRDLLLRPQILAHRGVLVGVAVFQGFLGCGGLGGGVLPVQRGDVRRGLLRNVRRLRQLGEKDLGIVPRGDSPPGGLATSGPPSGSLRVPETP